MSISEQISQLADTLERTRAQLAGVVEQIDALEGRRYEIINAKPHTDDIIACILGAIDSQARNFEQALAGRLNDTFVTPDDAAQRLSGSPISVLALEAVRPDAVTLAQRARDGVSPAANIGALAFLLRDRLVEEVPSLVARLCPAASKGMTAASRSKALENIDAQIAALQSQRDALQKDLTAARAAVMPRG
ncbi:MAG: hypothetical protein ACOY7T_10145 [Pseudomonadota bacterium]